MRDDGFTSFTYNDWEIGFVILTKLLGLVLPSYIWYIGVLSFIAVIPAAVFIGRNSEMPWLSTLLYVNLFIFFMEMNFLRQMISVSLLMLAWSFIKRNKFIPFVLTVLFASLFHQTVIFILPIYFIIKMQPKFKELIIYGYFILWFYMSSEGFINILTNFYHEEYSDSVFVTEGLSFVYAIFPLFVIICAFILVKFGTINVTNENKYLINLSLICTILMVTMSKHSILERFSYYFIIFMILLVPVIYRSLAAKGINTTLYNGKTIALTSEKQKKMLAIGFLIIVLALSYLHFYYGLFENAHGVKPFDIWLRFDGSKQLREFIAL
ncbi:MAG: EpsG family protein [Clostridia bacterium]|nr:EpsG family protein [Clostridia bacterium]